MVETAVSGVPETAGIQPSNVQARREELEEQRQARAERDELNTIQKPDTVEIRANTENRAPIEIDDIRNDEEALALAERAAQGLSAQISGMTTQSVVDILRTF